MTNSSLTDSLSMTVQGAGNAHWTWQRGGSATVVSLEGEALTVHSTVAFPPGAPLAAQSQNQVTFEMKVRTCRKLPSGTFEISGKLFNATRALREQLSAAVAAKLAAQR